MCLSLILDTARPMGFQYKKSVTFWLLQAARTQRVSFGSKLADLGLHAGQELMLKILAEENGQTMGALALRLGVQPPTVTKTVNRLAAQGLLERHVSDEDARQSHIFITNDGLKLIEEIDKTWKRLERRALSGFDEKEKRLLRKMLKKLDKNITQSNLMNDNSEDEDDVEDDEVPETVAS